VDYTPIMTEYVDIVRNVHELSNTKLLLDDDTLNAKSTELVSRAYRLLQMTPRITNETNTVIETLNTMLLDKITEDYDHDNDYHNNNNSNVDNNNLVDYSAFLCKYIDIANEAEKARVCGNDIRGRELIVQAFQANKTLMA
jgi:glycerol kinase